MKTNLPPSIQTVDDAKEFLKSLFDNGESYHPEDDAFDIVWNSNEPPTNSEMIQLNLLMEQIYELTYEFDPCEYLLALDPTYNDD